MLSILGGEMQLAGGGGWGVPWVSTDPSALLLPACSAMKNGRHHMLHHCDVLAEHKMPNDQTL